MLFGCLVRLCPTEGLRGNPRTEHGSWSQKGSHHRSKKEGLLFSTPCPLMSHKRPSGKPANGARFLEPDRKPPSLQKRKACFCGRLARLCPPEGLRGNPRTEHGSWSQEGSYHSSTKLHDCLNALPVYFPQKALGKTRERSTVPGARK